MFGAPDQSWKPWLADVLDRMSAHAAATTAGRRDPAALVDRRYNRLQRQPVSFSYALNKRTSNVLFWAVTVVDAPRDMPNLRFSDRLERRVDPVAHGQEVIGISFTTTGKRSSTMACRRG